MTLSLGKKMNRWRYEMFNLLVDNRSADETINMIKMRLWTFRFLKDVLSLLICISLNSVRTRVSCVVIIQTYIATKLVDLASISWSSHRLCVGHSAVFITQRLVSYNCVWVCVWVLFLVPFLPFLLKKGIPGNTWKCGVKCKHLKQGQVIL